MWRQDPNTSLQDPENVKPTGLCPGDTFFSYNYKIWITSGFIHSTGEEKLVPKFQDSFAFPLGTSTAIFDRNYCLTTLPSSTKQQCAQFCNARTSVPELNPYWLNRYDDDGRLKSDAATDNDASLSDSLIAAKSCKQQQQQEPGDQTINIQSSEDLLQQQQQQQQQGKALTGETNDFPTVPPANYFPLAGSPLRDLFQEDGLNDVDTFQHDSKAGPIPVNTDIGGSSSSSSSPDGFTGPGGIKKRAEKLRAP